MSSQVGRLRSEEHTSELQSRQYLVCRLLLEKKKFIMGPVGGSLQSPAGFDAWEDTAPWYVGLRRLDGLRIRRDPLLRLTDEPAGCALEIAPYLQAFLSTVAVGRFEVMIETGLDELAAPVDRGGRAGQLVRLLFFGRFFF